MRVRLADIKSGQTKKEERREYRGESGERRGRAERGEGYVRIHRYALEVSQLDSDSFILRQKNKQKKNKKN